MYINYFFAWIKTVLFMLEMCWIIFTGVEEKSVFFISLLTWNFGKVKFIKIDFYIF